MRLKAQHGLRIAQIILRILTALQAIPNHLVNVVKCISLIHFVLLNAPTLNGTRLTTRAS